MRLAGFARIDRSLLARVVAATTVALTALAGTAVAQETDPDRPGLSGEERVAALMERVQVEQERLKTLTARFSQRKESDLLLEPEISSGRFWYRAPDEIRWEFEDPADTVIVIRGDVMWTWYRDLGRAERVTLGEQAETIVQYLGASPSLSRLQSYFDVRVGFPDAADAPYSVHLDPRFERVRKRLSAMSLKLHRELYVPVFLRMSQAGGETTEIRFEQPQVDQDFAEDLFELDLPADVEVREIGL